MVETLRARISLNGSTATLAGVSARRSDSRLAVTMISCRSSGRAVHDQVERARLAGLQRQRRACCRRRSRSRCSGGYAGPAGTPPRMNWPWAFVTVVRSVPRTCTDAPSTGMPVSASRMMPVTVPVPACAMRAGGSGRQATQGHEERSQKTGSPPTSRGRARPAGPGEAWNVVKPPVLAARCCARPSRCVSSVSTLVVDCPRSGALRRNGWSAPAMLVVPSWVKVPSWKAW